MGWNEHPRGRVRIADWWERLRRPRAPALPEPMEFERVLDEVWEEADWVLLRVDALERSWRAEGEALR